MVFWLKAKKHLHHATGNIDELNKRTSASRAVNSFYIELSEGEPMPDFSSKDEEEYED